MFGTMFGFSISLNGLEFKKMNSFLAIHHLRAHKKNEKNSENVGKTMIFQVQVIPEDSKAQ